MTAGGAASVAWPVSADGYYDVIITASSGDGFTRRHAGPDRLIDRIPSS